METLRAELSRAKEQARISDAAALKAVEELRAEQAAHRRSEEKIAQMATELEDAANRRELLEKENQAKAADLKKALEAAKETRSEMRGIREELREAGDITAGRPFLLRMKFGDPKYAPLDQLWSAADAYADLAKSTTDASEFFKVQRFLGAVPHIDAVKRSACIEGARMALARVKTYWAGMEATAIATRGPAGGQDPAEHYFEEVLEGARLIEAQCSKSTMFE